MTAELASVSAYTADFGHSNLTLPFVLGVLSLQRRIEQDLEPPGAAPSAATTPPDHELDLVLLGIVALGRALRDVMGEPPPSAPALPDAPSGIGRLLR